MGDFGDQIRQWTVKTEGKIGDVARKIALDAFAEVIQKTPVDTGRARGNWQTAVNAVPTGTLESLDPSGAMAIAGVHAGVAGFKVGDIAYLANNLPYIMRLEEGYSKQAPSGMVRLTAQRFQVIADRAIAAIGAR